MTVANDKDPLLRTNSAYEGDVKDNLKHNLQCRHFVLLPSLCCYFLSLGTHFYISSQWIQQYVKTEVFGNKSITTVQDACKSHNESDPEYHLYQHVQETTANWNMYKSLTSSLCTIVVVTVLPSYSDSFGRRFLFFSGFVGIFVTASLQALSIYFNLSLWVVIAGSVVDSLLGSYMAVQSASNAFVSDVTNTAKHRTIGITTIDTITLLCITISGAIVGFVIQLKGFFFAQILAVGFAGLSLILLCFLPETHRKDRRANVHNVLDNFKRSFSFYGSKEFRGKRLGYLLLIGAYALTSLATDQRALVEMMYQLGMPFCWSSETIGLFSALRHAAQGILGMMLVVPLKMCFSDVTIATISTFFNGASYILEGLATTDLMMYLVAVPAVLSFLAVPMIKSVMSIITPSDKQGSLFASVVTVQAVNSLVNAFLLNYVYNATVRFFSGFVFLMMAGICGLSLFLLIIFALTQKIQPAIPPEEKNVNVKA